MSHTLYISLTSKGILKKKKLKLKTGTPWTLASHHKTGNGHAPYDWSVIRFLISIILRNLRRLNSFQSLLSFCKNLSKVVQHSLA